MTTTNRAAYRQLINEDLAWLKQKTRTLERDHIEQIIKWSIRVLYDGEPADAFAPRNLPERRSTAPPCPHPRGTPNTASFTDSKGVTDFL